MCYFIGVLNVKASKMVIYIDPGHGGIDGGCISSNGEYEKEIVLDIAYSLKEYLELNGYYPLMTRSGDYDLASYNSINRKREDIIKRTDMINNSNCKLAISIHANAYPSSKEKGAQVFYNNKNDNSKKLAEFIQDNLKEKLNNTDRLAMDLNNKYILENVKCPIVIVEVGFLSNKEEAELLKTSDYQKVMGYTIGEAIINFLNSKSY